MTPPFYFSRCIEDDSLEESMSTMLETVSRNLESGFHLELELLINYVQEGMSLESFNQLVFNLNQELSTQYENGPACPGLNVRPPAVH